MAEELQLQAFVASLPEIETARLPAGTLFTARRLIYQVTEARSGGFHKARQWRADESTDVALVPGSFLVNTLPLVAKGRLLPIFPNRAALLDEGEILFYLFPDEQQALDAAYLDAALVKSQDVYVRNHGREPAFAITDGVHLYRIYYYNRSSRGYASEASAKTIQFKLSSRGPMYWRLLPSWHNHAPWASETIPNMQPVRPPDDI
ncbi:MAG: hypothetical protein JW910_05140 [Anaerolineae bacterium]|nr:hypothetical protein [Anaerolineae bacterium]